MAMSNAKRAPRLEKSDPFLLDIHTEPFPARFVAPALEQLRARAAGWLEGKIDHGEIRIYGTLRHLVLAIDSVAAKGCDQSERFRGPKAHAGKTPDGGYTAAAEGFARKYGLSAAELVEDEGVLYAEVRRKGAAAVELLKAMIPDVLRALQFPKTMTWEATGYKFGRPIRAITALYGDRVLPVVIAGVRSGRGVYGHPTYAKSAAILKNPRGHLKLLRDSLVIADPTERRSYLLKQLAAAAKSAGGQPDLDDALVEETVYMAEHPTPVVGKLRLEHMNLPAALLKMVMKKQLKFFPIVDGRGMLCPAFIGVRDGLSTGNALVREGYQRVLEARFNDAAFFFGRDSTTQLRAKASGLERVIYQKSLGTLAQKTNRVETLSAWIAARLRDGAPLDEAVVRQASPLVYADLLTDVVKEFPELQGHMGGVYARRDGLGEKVALCLEQFYYPIAAKTPVPATREAGVVSLAGKLDSVAGCFAAGLVPTGSADPYALRRQALGALRIVLEHQLPIDLEAAAAESVKMQPLTVPEPAKLQGQVLDFIWGRAASLFEELDFRADEIRSIRSGALRDLPSAFRRLSAVHALRADPSFEPLTSAYKRAANILKQSSGLETAMNPERARLRHESEIGLYDALVAVESRANERILRGDFEGALKELVALKPHLDRFFDGVMVMVDDTELRRQRFGLLTRLANAFKRVADLSEIQPATP